MHIILKTTLFFVLLLCISFARAERVECPAELKWRFEGYCGKELGKENGAKCPQGGRLTRVHVTGPIMCVSEGKCSGDRIPNSVGVCVDPPNKKPIISLPSSSH